MPLFRSKVKEEPKSPSKLSKGDDGGGPGAGRFFRRLSLQTGTVARKLRFDSSMAEIELLEWLQEIQDNPQYSNISFDEVNFGSNVLSKIVQVFSSLSKRQRGRCYWDRFNVEFCQGAVDMVVTTALLMECIKHLFVATDVVENENSSGPGLIVRLAAALKVNLSLKSLWLLIPMTFETATALGEALAGNDSLDKLSLSGSQWALKAPGGGENDYEGHDTDTYGTDTDDDDFVDSRWATSDEDDSEDNDYETKNDKGVNVQIMRYTDPQWAEQALRLPRALADGFRQNTSLRTIDLSCCRLRDDALGTLLEALVGHPTLETLDISRNRAGQQTIRALADILAYPETALTTLDLREQRKMPKPARVTKRKGSSGSNKGGRRGREGKDDDGEEDEDEFDAGSGDGLDLMPLSQALYNNEILQVLKLSHNRLVDDQIAELVRNLQGNETLQELDLQFNSITARGLKTLTKGLSELPSLKVLLLGGNDFGKEGKKILAQLEDDDDSVCTIMENGGGGKSAGKNDDDDSFHSAKSSNTYSKTGSGKSAVRSTAFGGGFMGGLTGISEK